MKCEFIETFMNCRVTQEFRLKFETNKEKLEEIVKKLQLVLVKILKIFRVSFAEKPQRSTINIDAFTSQKEISQIVIFSHFL